MFSPHWPSWLALLIKILAGSAGLGAAATGFWAARLWLQASKITIPLVEPPIASVEDAPALWDYAAMVGVFGAHDAFARSSELNARAARWASAAAALTGVAAVLSVL